MTERRPEGATHRPDRAALAIALALAVVAGVVFWSTASMPAAASYARIGPTAFPYAVATGLLLLAAGTAAKALKGGFPARERDEAPPVLWIVGGLVAQLLLLKPLGFSVATGLLFAATARGFGRGPLWLTIPAGIVLAFAIWIAFSRVLQLSLPAGPLERLFF